MRPKILPLFLILLGMASPSYADELRPFSPNTAEEFGKLLEESGILRSTSYVAPGSPSNPPWVLDEMNIDNLYRTNTLLTNAPSGSASDPNYILVPYLQQLFEDAGCQVRTSINHPAIVFNLETLDPESSDQCPADNIFLQEYDRMEGWFQLQVTNSGTHQSGNIAFPAAIARADAPWLSQQSLQYFGLDSATWSDSILNFQRTINDVTEPDLQRVLSSLATDYMRAALESNSLGALYLDSLSDVVRTEVAVQATN